MKRVYIKPSMEVFELQQQGCLLTNSNPGYTGYVPGMNGSSQLV